MSAGGRMPSKAEFVARELIELSGQFGKFPERALVLEESEEWLISSNRASMPHLLDCTSHFANFSRPTIRPIPQHDFQSVRRLAIALSAPAANATVRPSCLMRGQCRVSKQYEPRKCQSHLILEAIEALFRATSS